MDLQPEHGVLVSGRRVWLPVLVLVLLGCALYLPRLGTSGLWDPWEPKYAQTAREMGERGDWIIPYYREDQRLNKAPLTYWLIATSHAVLGVNETAARLPSALLAILGAAALGFAFSARGRPTEGLVAGAALLTGPQWLLTGRFATPDMPLASFLAIALALVLLRPPVASGAVRWLFPGLLILLVAAAGMTDWPRGLLLPAWAVLGWGALRWNWKGSIALLAVAAVYHAAQLQQNVPLNLAAVLLALVLAAVVLRVRAGVSVPALLLGALAIAMLVTPWFWVAHDREPEEWSLFRYKYAFNLGETLDKHTGPYTFPIRTVALGAMPWGALAVIGLFAALRRRERDEMAAVLAGGFLGATLFFTLSEAQMGHFYTVIQPAVAGLAGIGAVNLMRRLDWSVAPAAAALLATWAIAWKSPFRILETATVKFNLFDVELTFVVVGVVAAWVLVLVAAKIRGAASWVVLSIAPAAVLAGALGWWVVPALEAKKTVKPLWEVYLDQREGAEPIGVYGLSKDSAYYYSNNAIERLRSTEDLLAFLDGPGPRFLVGTKSMLDGARRAAGGHWEVLSREHPTLRLARFRPSGDIPI